MTLLEKTLYDALKGLLGVSHRLTGCPVPECRTCQQNNAAVEAAKSTVRNYEDGKICRCGHALSRHAGACCAEDMDPEGFGCSCVEFEVRS